MDFQKLEELLEQLEAFLQGSEDEPDEESYDQLILRMAEEDRDSLIAILGTAESILDDKPLIELAYNEINNTESEEE